MKQRLTGYNLVSFIDQLDKSRTYNYVNPKTKGLIRIMRVDLPIGPIVIKRCDPSKGGTFDTAKEESMSSEMIWRLANALFEGKPVNVDRVYGASYNTRSVLEALIAHTPQFYYCYPGRILDVDGSVSVERGHKHIIWLPSEPHANGVMLKKEIDGAVSEIPERSIIYDALSIPDSVATPEMDINIARRHTQIQVAIYLIGLQLGYRTWIAQNDKGVLYNGIPLVQQDGIVKSLSNEKMVEPHDGAVKAGLFIDCIWFRDKTSMPAVMEIEHSTGVTSGLERMLNFSKQLPFYGDTRYVIVAPDDDRERVIREANKDAFKPLNVRYFPYSAVEELYALCTHRKIRGISDEFLDCYMEPTLK